MRRGHAPGGGAYAARARAWGRGAELCGLPRAADRSHTNITTGLVRLYTRREETMYTQVGAHPQRARRQAARHHQGTATRAEQ